MLNGAEKKKAAEGKVVAEKDVAEKKAQVPETEGEERAVRKERRAALKAKRAEPGFDRCIC